MSRKPTYEELEDKIKDLERKILECDRMEGEVEKIFKFSLDMICSGNLEGYFTKINSSFVSILGYTEEEFLAKPFILFVHDDDVEKTKEVLAETRKGKQKIYSPDFWDIWQSAVAGIFYNCSECMASCPIGSD